MIRTATPDDAQALAGLHASAWQQAHAGLLPPALLDALDTSTGADNWQRILADADNTTAVRLDQTADGELAGFASFGPSQDDDAAGHWGEILAMYYSQRYWGHGRAAKLWERVHEELTGAGYSRISLWVLFENTRAIAFYRKHGFVFDGRERTAAVRGATLREVRMVWAPA